MRHPEKKLLVIYYNFPPVKVPGGVRVFHFCRAAAHHFGGVQALTSKNREFFQKDEGLQLDEVPITAVTTWDMRRLLAMRWRATKGPVVSSAAKSSVMGRLLKRLVDSFPFNMLIGDGGLVYILTGYRAAKRMVRQQGITHIFSTFRPYSDHMIAYLLKRRYPHLIWVADFRDLHLDEKHGRQLFFWPLQVWCNRKILSRADLVTTVSQGLARKLALFTPTIRLLRNGIPDLRLKPTPQSRSFFAITYTGRIYPGEQQADLLFATLAKMIHRGEIPAAHLRLIYAGPTPEHWRAWIQHYGLETNMVIRGLLPLREARQLQVDSAINLQLAYSSTGQKGDLSSKVYEYLAAGRPILAVINGEEDAEFETFFATFRPGLLIYDQSDQKAKLEAFLLAQYRNWASGRTNSWPKNREAAAAWRTERLMNEFFEELLTEHKSSQL